MITCGAASVCHLYGVVDEFGGPVHCQRREQRGHPLCVVVNVVWRHSTQGQHTAHVLHLACVRLAPVYTPHHQHHKYQESSSGKDHGQGDAAGVVTQLHVPTKQTYTPGIHHHSLTTSWVLSDSNKPSLYAIILSKEYLSLNHCELDKIFKYFMLGHFKAR